jgi:hypothetical protein
MRKEVVSNEKAEKDKVVNDALEIKAKWQFKVLELQQ